jgi:glycosyltransferase involved in cell wall biosynthesis
MKQGIVLCTYNRPEYLRQTLDCLINTDFDIFTEIVIVDDCSDEETKNMIKSFVIKNKNVIINKIYKELNLGMYDSLETGFFYLNRENYDYFCNIDSDVIMKKDWLIAERRLVDKFPHHIITGYNAGNTEKHKILCDGGTYYLKRTANGINFMFNKNNYVSVMECFKYKNAWDQHLSSLMLKQLKGIISTKPSCVQHIGDISSDTLNHNFKDKAIDY